MTGSIGNELLGDETERDGRFACQVACSAFAKQVDFVLHRQRHGKADGSQEIPAVDPSFTIGVKEQALSCRYRCHTMDCALDKPLGLSSTRLPVSFLQHDVDQTDDGTRFPV